MKACTKCGVVKPLDGFYRRASVKDGRRSECKVCEAEQNHAYRAVNREAIVERKRAYRAANREAIRKRERAHAVNREAIAERKRAYRAANPEVARVNNAKRRARAADADYGWEINELIVLERADGACESCGRDVDAFDRSTFEIDHIIPYAKDGIHHPGNLQLLCTSCNRSKNARMPDAGGYGKQDIRIGLQHIVPEPLPEVPENIFPAR